MKKFIVLATTIALSTAAGTAFADMRAGHGGYGGNRGYDMGAGSDPHDMKQMMMQMHAMMERGGNFGGNMMGGGNFGGGMMGGGNFGGGMMGGGNFGGNMMGGGNSGGNMMGGGNFGGNMMGGGNFGGGMMGGGNSGGNMMGGGNFGGGMMGPMAGMLDSDGDGTVTVDEANAQLRAMHADFDADGDGSLSITEFEALNSSLVRDMMVDRFQFLDADGDGNVSLEEMGAPSGMMGRAPTAQAPAPQNQMMNGMNQGSDAN